MSQLGRGGCQGRWRGIFPTVQPMGIRVLAQGAEKMKPWGKYFIQKGATDELTALLHIKFSSRMECGIVWNYFFVLRFSEFKDRLSTDSTVYWSIQLITIFCDFSIFRCFSLSSNPLSFVRSDIEEFWHYPLYLWRASQRFDWSTFGDPVVSIIYLCTIQAFNYLTIDFDHSL